MAARWFYGRDEARRGPFSAAEMKALASSGGVLPDDTVWQEGVERGVPARKVKNLFPLAAAAALAAAEELTAPPAAPEAAPHAEGAAARVPEAPPAPAAPAAPPSGGWQQGPARTGRASAGRGAVIVGQDGVNVKVRKKCTACGHLDSSWATVPIRAGTTRLTFYCPKCRKARDVEVVGSLS
jgi:hypothetical protein